MADGECKPVTVSRRIDAPASVIFQLLADPARHPAFDGSGMLRPGAPAAVISDVGDVFVMKMQNESLGHYEMENHVVEYEQDRRIAWDPALHAVDRPDQAPVAIGIPAGQRWAFDLVPAGPDSTTVTEIYDCTGAPARIRAAVDNGNGWIEAMTKTLERLDELST
jgi:uncharacterized protein YndB with AHSA1/START domain